MPRSPLMLSHPGKFETRTLPTKDIKDANQKVSHRIDNQVLDVQGKLASRVANDEVSLSEFCDTVRDLETFQAIHARYRAKGLTVTEQASLKKAFKMVGKNKPKKIDLKLKALYKQVRGGVLNKDEMVEELNWRTQVRYGAEALNRDGVIYQEERQKVRANLYIPRQEKPDPLKKNYHHPGLEDLAHKALVLFPELDVDGNDVLDRREARAFLTDYEELGLSAAEATTLYTRQKELASLLDPKTSGENLTREDLQVLLPEFAPENPDKDLKETITKISKRLRYQEKTKTPEPQPFLLTDDFDASSVKQGKEGSCWMLCNLPALNADELGKLIQPEGEDFRVTLADGRTTVVTELNEAERRTYSSGNGEWSALVEKGISQILSRENKDLNGGFARIGRQMLAGDKSVQLYLDRKNKNGPDLRDREVLFETMETAFDSGSAIFAAALKDDHEKEISEISASGHAYTVLDLDRENDSVIVRNPWGRNESADLDGVNNGVFELSQDQFFANFSYIYVDESVA